MIMKVIIFVALSTVLFLKFREELFAFKKHGPYMFVAAEGLLLLLIFNGEYLFENFFTLRQSFSWALMLISAVFAVLGFYGLKRYGRAVEHWENTTRLVQEGVFRYIRHPLYASLMFLATGILLKDVSSWATLTWILTLCFLVAASWAEERENGAKFGVEYERYALKTRRYVPFIV